MRSHTYSVGTGREQRREQWLRARTAAGKLHAVFPNVANLRVELRFDDQTSTPPAPQAHVLHPPARAFFEFLCPFADCSGTFDLEDIATQAINGSRGQVKGTLECAGVRARERTGKSPCGMRMQYVIAVQYRRPEDSGNEAQR